MRSHCKECIKIYRNNHKDTIQQYRNNHRHERQQYRKKYYQNNKWKEQQQNKEYRKTHTEQILNKKNQWTKQRYQSDFTFKYRMRISQGLQKAFKSIHYSKNGISIFTILRYSQQQFNERLLLYLNKPCERCGKINITTNNSHIDHIIPMSLAKTEKELIQLNQLENLRLICSQCNLTKSDKLDFDNAILPKIAHFYINRSKQKRN